MRLVDGVSFRRPRGSDGCNDLSIALGIDRAVNHVAGAQGLSYRCGRNPRPRPGAADTAAEQGGAEIEATLGWAFRRWHGRTEAVASDPLTQGDLR